MTEFSMWDDTAGTLTAEHHKRQATLAVAAVEPLWPFLSQASTPSEFEGRLSLSTDSVRRLVAQVAEDDHQKAAHIAALSLRERFSALQRDRSATATLEAALRAAVAAEEGHAAPTDHEAKPEWDTATAHDLCDTCGWPVSKGKEGNWSHDAKNPVQWTDKRTAAKTANGGKATTVAGAVNYLFEENPKSKGATIADIAYVMGTDNATAKRQIEHAVAQGSVVRGENGRLSPKSASKQASDEGTLIFETGSGDYDPDRVIDNRAAEDLVGKRVRLICFNDYGVATEHMGVGRITGFTPTADGSGEIEWDEEGGTHAYPISTDDLAKIYRLGEPTDADQMSLFSRRKTAAEAAFFNNDKKRRQEHQRATKEYSDNRLKTRDPNRMSFDELQEAHGLGDDDRKRQVSDTLRDKFQSEPGGEFDSSKVKRHDGDKSASLHTADIPGYSPTGETFTDLCDICKAPVTFEWYETGPGGFRTSTPVDGGGSDYLGTWCAQHVPAHRNASKTAGLSEMTDDALLSEMIATEDRMGKTVDAEMRGSMDEWMAQVKTEVARRGLAGAPARRATLSVCPECKGDTSTDCAACNGSGVKTAAGSPEGWWPQNRDSTFPGEKTLGCPACGGPVMMEGYHGPGGRLGDPGGGTTLRCTQCGKTQSFPHEASRHTAVGENGQCQQVKGGVQCTKPNGHSEKNHSFDKAEEMVLAASVRGPAVTALLKEAADSTHDTLLPGGHLGNEEPKFEVVVGDEVQGQYGTREDAEDKVDQIKEEKPSASPEIKELSKTSSARTSAVAALMEAEAAYFHAPQAPDPTYGGAAASGGEGEAPYATTVKPRTPGAQPTEVTTPTAKDPKVGYVVHAGIRREALRVLAEADPDAIDGLAQQTDFEQPTGVPVTTRPRVMPTEHANGLFDPAAGGVDSPGGSPLAPTIGQRVTARIQRLASRVLVDNPDMSRREAVALAARTVANFPQMVSGEES